MPNRQCVFLLTETLLGKLKTTQILSQTHGQTEALCSGRTLNSCADLALRCAADLLAVPDVDIKLKAEFESVRSDY